MCLELEKEEFETSISRHGQYELVYAREIRITNVIQYYYYTTTYQRIFLRNLIHCGIGIHRDYCRNAILVSIMLCPDFGNGLFAFFC